MRSLVEVERRSEVEDPEDVLTARERQVVDDILDNYKAEVAIPISKLRDGRLSFREFHVAIDEVKHRYLPVASHASELGEELDHNAAINDLFISESRRFVYDQVRNEEWRDQLLEDWWALDHPNTNIDRESEQETTSNDVDDNNLCELYELDLNRGYGVQRPYGEENVEKAKQVINTYDKFAFARYW